MPGKSSKSSKPSRLGRSKSMFLVLDSRSKDELIKKFEKENTERNKHAENVEDALNKMKKFDSKDLWQILDGKSVLIPEEAVNELLKAVKFYEKQIEQYSHASASAKLKNVFHLSVKEGSKEDNRRKTLKEAVINLGALLDAFVYFFIGCSNLGAISNPLLVKFGGVITKLGPKGKGYIESEKKLRSDSLWKKCYDEKLSKLSKKYCFDKAANDIISDEYKLLINNIVNNKINFASYRERVKIVYEIYRMLVKGIKSQIEIVLKDSFDKLKSNNNLYGAMKYTLLNTCYESATFIKQRYEKLQNETNDFIKKYHKIFYSKEVKPLMDDLLNKIKNYLNELKEMSEFIAQDNMTFTMETNNTKLNSSTESVINTFGMLLAWLRKLKGSLLQGNYYNVEITCKNFCIEYQNVNKTLKLYIKLIETISKDSTEKEALQMACKIKVEQIVKFEERCSEINNDLNNCIKNINDLPEKYKQGKVTDFIKIASMVLSECSMFLGPVAGFLAKFLQFAGSTETGINIGTKILDKYYG